VYGGLKNMNCVDQIDRNTTKLVLSYTGRFKMYSGITQIYYRKPVGHVFMEPVQTEGTTQNFFPQ